MNTKSTRARPEVMRFHAALIMTPRQLERVVSKEDLKELFPSAFSSFLASAFFLTPLCLVPFFSRDLQYFWVTLWTISLHCSLCGGSSLILPHTQTYSYTLFENTLILIRENRSYSTNVALSSSVAFLIEITCNCFPRWQILIHPHWFRNTWQKSLQRAFRVFTLVGTTLQRANRFSIVIMSRQVTPRTRRIIFLWCRSILSARKLSG